MRRRNVVLWCFLGRSKRPANQDVQPSLQFMEPQMMTQLLAGAPPPPPQISPAADKCRSLPRKSTEKSTLPYQDQPHLPPAMLQKYKTALDANKS